MIEDLLLEKTLEILESSSYEEAYQFLLTQKSNLKTTSDSPTLYYYLMCLASGIGKFDDALNWFSIAINDFGYWYRDEMLEDDDLEPLFDSPIFQNLKSISKIRMKKSSSISKPFSTWKEKKKENLLLSFHGNGENAQISKQIWSQLETNMLQVEALQSSTVDSFNRFRWNYDNSNFKDSLECINNITWAQYNKRFLAGFSAGCDMILRLISNTPVTCNAILLQSPWIPYIENDIDKIKNALIEKNISVHLFVGTNDDDCIEMAQTLYSELSNSKIKTSLEIQTGIRHHFPSELGSVYTNIF